MVKYQFDDINSVIPQLPDLKETITLKHFNILII